jgi:hypothetical protein
MKKILIFNLYMMNIKIFTMEKEEIKITSNKILENINNLLSASEKDITSINKEYFKYVKNIMFNFFKKITGVNKPLNPDLQHIFIMFLIHESLTNKQKSSNGTYVNGDAIKNMFTSDVLKNFNRDLPPDGGVTIEYLQKCISNDKSYEIEVNIKNFLVENFYFIKKTIETFCKLTITKHLLKFKETKNQENKLSEIKEYKTRLEKIDSKIKKINEKTSPYIFSNNFIKYINEINEKNNLTEEEKTHVDLYKNIMNNYNKKFEDLSKKSQVISNNIEFLFNFNKDDKKAFILKELAKTDKIYLNILSTEEPATIENLKKITDKKNQLNLIKTNNDLNSRLIKSAEYIDKYLCSDTYLKETQDFSRSSQIHNHLLYYFDISVLEETTYEIFHKKIANKISNILYYKEKKENIENNIAFFSTFIIYLHITYTSQFELIKDLLNEEVYDFIKKEETIFLNVKKDLSDLENFCEKTNKFFSKEIEIFIETNHKNNTIDKNQKFKIVKNGQEEIKNIYKI